MNDSYRFPGIPDFIPADAGLHPASLGKIPGLWPVARAVDALSQVPTAPPEARADIMRAVEESELMLTAALATIRAAKQEVIENCFPKSRPKPSPSPTATSETPPDRHPSTKDPKPA